MRRLPRTIAFDDRDFPELAGIFSSIDAEIAAIVESDPAMRARLERGSGSAAPGASSLREAHGQQQAA